jgi:hypothetical protein
MAKTKTAMLMGQYRKLPEVERMRMMLDDLAKVADGRYGMLQVCDCDIPFLERALVAELEKAGEGFVYDGYEFRQVEGTDPTWKGWGVRGGARFNNGWIISKDGKEVHRIPPDAVNTPFEFAKKEFESAKRLGEFVT